MEIFRCQKCSHLWSPRREEKPKCCPHCKQYEWDKPLTKKEREAKEEKEQKK